jgi:hypothetical protein
MKQESYLPAVSPVAGSIDNIYSLLGGSARQVFLHMAKTWVSK